MSLVEQRKAFSSLKAIRAGKRVSNIRTGHRVRDYIPGTVPQISASVQRPNHKIQIYQVRQTRGLTYDSFSAPCSKSRLQ